jgi:hypothetical protein
MMKNAIMDTLTKEILKKSYLEITDPDFNETTMKNILRESHRQHVRDNIFLSFLIFISVDTLIFLVLWLTGLNIFELSLRLIGMPHEILSQTAKVQNSILKDGPIQYILFSIGGIIVLLMLADTTWKLFDKPKHRGN